MNTIISMSGQVAAGGTRYLRACTTRMAVFWPENFILKTMMFRDLTTVLNERKHLKMVIRSVPDSFSLILDRTERSAFPLYTAQY